MYAHVKEDGSVDYLGSLPESWANVSGLRLSKGDDVYLKTVGWLQIVETFVTPTYNQTFDPDVITVEEDRVTLVHRVRDMTPEEKTIRDESHIYNLRYERDEKLAASDWTHLSDHPAPLSDTKKTEWTTYRQALRDLPATADMLTWPDSFNWPAEPE